MKIFTLIFVLCLAAKAESLDDKTANRIADAIFKIENSKKFPYGIRSIPIKGDTEQERVSYARKACIQTVKNQYIRWQKAGKTNSFEESLGNRYCPVVGDKTGLNKNWVKNLRFYLKKEN